MTGTQSSQFEHLIETMRRAAEQAKALNKDTELAFQMGSLATLAGTLSMLGHDELARTADTALRSTYATPSAQGGH